MRRGVGQDLGLVSMNAYGKVPTYPPKVMYILESHCRGIAGIILGFVSGYFWFREYLPKDTQLSLAEPLMLMCFPVVFPCCSPW